MFCLREEVKGCAVQTPVIFGYGDCRTCSFVTNICSEDKEDWCIRDVPVCCWECEHLFDCIDRFIQMWGASKEDKDFLRTFFKCDSLEAFKEGIKRLKQRLGKI